jgi:hypothetical protein
VSWTRGALRTHQEPPLVTNSIAADAIRRARAGRCHRNFALAVSRGDAAAQGEGGGRLRGLRRPFEAGGRLGPAAHSRFTVYSCTRRREPTERWLRRAFPGTWWSTEKAFWTRSSRLQPKAEALGSIGYKSLSPEVSKCQRCRRCRLSRQCRGNVEAVSRQCRGSVD